MAGQHQQYSPRYPSLLVTFKHKSEDRITPDTYSNPRTRRSKDNYYPLSFQSKSVYFNGNHRYQQPQHFIQRPQTPPRRQQQQQQQQQFYNKCDRIQHQYIQQQQQPIRPLMEIKDNSFPLHNDIDYDIDDDDNDKSCRTVPQKEAKQQQQQQRSQYRNRKAELDWDHAFDLDLINLYTTHIDTDSHSVTSTISSTDTSFSSI
ncbi:unnamed protein product [Adineta steineri]|uniref:Uncharacterized protein n=1 Tax=Adineta steineri TaxID=433720 RepID=A0A813XEM1_9BILA|nr:unnamed protein product [Adineta steineri]CAF3502403.1 unnamed protein product [Adineta steineri]